MQAEARQIAEDIYVYGYSLITTEVTRGQRTTIQGRADRSEPMEERA
jgi:hypothetical protein